MSRLIRLTSQERELLKKLPLRTLQFFKKIEGDSEFKSFKEVVDLLIDMEKNNFFGEGIEHEPQKLAIDHAFSRGGIAMITTFLKIIMTAKEESLRREQERKRRKDEEI